MYALLWRVVERREERYQGKEDDREEEFIEDKQEDKWQDVSKVGCTQDKGDDKCKEENIRQ